MLSIPRKLAYLAEAAAVQWLPRAQLEALQLRRLRKILEVAARVPLYREHWKRAGVSPADVRTLADLKNLPIVTREEVVSAWPKGILSREPRPDDVVFRTSGTSGMFMQIAYAAEANDFLEAIYGRALFSAGYRPWDRIAYFWWDAADRPLRPYERVGLMRKHFLRVHADPRKQLEDLIALQPSVIYHFPSALLLIAKLVEGAPLPIRPRLIICHGELLTDDQQETLRRVFQCDVRNQYGAQEFNRMAWDCDRGTGLHVDADSVRIEILRSDDTLAAPGEEGELVVTGLVNTLMPLVRYRIGDVGYAIEQPCPCGRGLPLIKLTEGRRDDVLILPDGRRVGPRTLAPRIEDLQGFLQYRVIQHAPSKLEVLLVRDGDHQGVESSVRDTIAAILGPELSIDVRNVDEISLSRRGKLRKIVRAFSA
ncbi:MAG: phenylacetate--CoA ligase family protein [Polyangiales bacterium]